VAIIVGPNYMSGLPFSTFGKGKPEESSYLCKKSVFRQ